MLPWPPPSPPCPQCKINPKFSLPFQRAVYIVVRAAATHNDIPAHLEPFFAAKTPKPSGFACTSLMAQADITNYGFSTHIWARRRNQPGTGMRDSALESRRARRLRTPRCGVAAAGARRGYPLAGAGISGRFAQKTHAAIEGTNHSATGKSGFASPQLTTGC